MSLLHKLKGWKVLPCTPHEYAGKDVFWYAREKQDDRSQAVQDELQLVKAREEELMMEVCPSKNGNLSNRGYS